MKIKKTHAYIGGALVLIVAFFAFQASLGGDHDALAQCLTSNGVKMFGAFWCNHCESQKADFGSSFQYVTYIECSTPDGRGQTQICSDEEIESYPTWEFPDGSRESGVKSFEELAQKGGCEL